MKVLIVASYRSYSTSGMAPFVTDQGEALKRNGVDVKYFLVNGHGVIGYIANFPKLLKVTKDFKPDLAHAHFGLC